ncbi:MAG: cell division protein FtsA [Pseudomonadota bacterium]|nr:cell division protein FtsA [Pseudomonadota bacterium]
MSEKLYAMQLKLRRRRLSAIKKGFIGLIDVGSSKIVCLILKFTPEIGNHKSADDKVDLPSNVAFRIIGTATTRSRGVVFGEIDSMDEVERGIRTVVQASQKMAGLLIEDVLVSFSGGDPRSYGIYAETKIVNREVSEFDIGNALTNCHIPDYGSEREIVHALPVNFTLDDRTGLVDPRGLVGSELKVDMHMMTLERSVVRNVVHAIKKCSLGLSGISFAPYLSGLSSLTEDELEIGTGCIDMGGGTSGLAIFFRKQLIFGATVRLGGVHITSDIMKAFEIPFDMAERIKTLHGGLFSTGRDDRDLIEINDLNSDTEKERKKISRSELIGVIRPRVEEIFEELRLQLDESGFDNLRSRKIVLTGGVSRLPGLFDLATKILDCPVRIGKPIRLQGLPIAANGADFAAAVGLALNAGHPQDECWDFKGSKNSYGMRKINGWLRWISENW